VKTAVIYARVSTVRQANEELPIQSQLEQCRRKAESLPAIIVEVFLDEGVSGRGDRRPQFQAAIEYCENRRVDYFVTWSTSRFARNKLDAALYKMRLAKCGTEMVYVSLSIDRNTDGGWVTEGVMELFDEMYSRQIAADTRRSMLKNARDGYWNGGRPPYGYKPVPATENPKRKKLALVPEEAATVQEIFRMKQTGQGAKTIAIALSSQGIANRGLDWNKKSVTAVLRNPAYTGKIVFGKRDPVLRRKTDPATWSIVQCHEPIIDDDVWNSVQQIMNSETNCQLGSPHSTWFFTGLIHCAECSASMHIETAKGRSRRYQYYNCSTAQEGSGCKNRRIRADKLDEWLVQTICQRIFTREHLLDVVEELNRECSTYAMKRREKRAQLSKSLQTFQQRNEKIYELFETYGKNCPNLGDLTTRLRANNAEIKRLESELARLDNEAAPVVTVKEADIDRLSSLLMEIIATSQNPKKIRNFFGSFIEKIQIYSDSVKISYKPECLLQSEMVPSKGIWLPRTGSNRRPSD
jgi:site-specific DNA recombinase